MKFSDRVRFALYAQQSKWKMRAIQSVALQVLEILGPPFTNTPNGHIQTDIAATGMVAGLCLLQETVPKSTLINSYKDKSVTVLMSNIHQKEQFLFWWTELMLDANDVISIDATKNEFDIPIEHEPKFNWIEMENRLAPTIYKLCSDAKLGRKYHKFVAVGAGMMLIKAGSNMNLLSADMGKKILLFNITSGCRRIPSPESLWPDK